MRKSTRPIATILIVAIIVAALVIFVPRLAHTCDNCDSFFIGTGYTANIVSNAITSITGQEDKILCKDCAAKEHSLAIAAGKSLSDFKRPLFGDEDDK